MSKITLTIDDLEIKARRDMTILEAALENDIYIPHLCYHPDLKPAGVCRVCVVEIEGRGMTISCKAPVEQGIIVRTESSAIQKVRKMAVALLLANHEVDCLTCESNNNCELQKIAQYVGIEQEELNKLRKPEKTYPVDSFCF